MQFHFFENTLKTIQFGLIWLIYALVQAFVLVWIVPVSFLTLLGDGCIHSMLFAALGVLLWGVLKYGNFEALTLSQWLVNHIALAFLSVTIWVGVGFGLFYLIYGVELAKVVIPFLPIRTLIGLLIYILIIQLFIRGLKKVSVVEPESKVDVVQDNSLATKGHQKELLERIAVKSGSKIHVILVPDVIYLQADGDYVQIVTAQGKYLKEQTMKSFEEQLPDNQFVRVHRSVIVNVEMISRIELYEKQNQLLTLKNGQQIKTSPSGYKALRMALNL